MKVLMKVSMFAFAAGALCAEALAALTGGVVPGLPTHSLGMPSCEPPEGWGVSNDSLYWDALSVFDGDPATKMDDYAYFGVSSARGSINFDAGTARHVTGMRIKQTSAFGDRNQNVKLLGSNDGETWENVVENAGTVVGNAEFTELAARPGVGRFRYFRIDDSVVNDLTDVEIISDDILIKANAPQAWADETLTAGDAADGVLVSGQLVYAAEDVEVTAYASRHDYGDNLSSWQKYGESLQIGTVQPGAAFSGRFTNLKSGVYHWRFFGAAAGTSVASAPTRPFVVGSSDSAAPMFMNLKGTGSSDLYRIYDASLDGQFGNIATNTVWFTFDCSAIAAHDMTASIKFWPVSQYRRTWNSLRGVKIDVSFDEPVADKDWGAEDVSSWGGRLKQMGAEEPKGLTWQTVATGEVLTDIQSGVEEIVLPKFEKMPTYIRVRDLYKGQLYEVQLRTCRRPSGFAIIVR